MTTPPMVGVPALCWWVAGPSSRICWTSERARKYRIHSGVSKSAQRNPTPPDSIKLNTTHSPQQFLRYHAIYQWDHELTDRLGRFVALTRDHHHVSRAGALDGQRNGQAPIALAKLPSIRPAPRHHRINDVIWLLRSGVIRRNYCEIRRPCGS